VATGGAGRSRRQPTNACPLARLSGAARRERPAPGKTIVVVVAVVAAAVVLSGSLVAAAGSAASPGLKLSENYSHSMGSGPEASGANQSGSEPSAAGRCQPADSWHCSQT